MGGWVLREEHGRVGLEGRSMGGRALRGGAWEGGPCGEEHGRVGLVGRSMGG